MDFANLDTPLFHRAETKAAVSDVCLQNRLVIFAGAGATIDKSGLTWRSMIDALLEPHLDEDQRKSCLKMLDPKMAGTVAHELYLSGVTARSTDSDMIGAQLSAKLYKPGTWQHGRLGASIADFVKIWVKSSTDERPRSVCVATTNYDDYLYSDLVESLGVTDDGSESPEVRVRFPTKVDVLDRSNDLDSVHRSAIVSKWVDDRRPMPRDSREGEAIDFHFLHGRIPLVRNASKGKRRIPVVSEIDYIRTRKWTVEALTKLYSSASVVLVGSGMDDPPQLEALANTLDISKENNLRRWAIMTAPTGSAKERQEYCELISLRLGAFGVDPIFIDYHVQAVQLFRELGLCATKKTPQLYAQSVGSKCRYGSRVMRWWEDWRSRAAKFGLADHQFLSHTILFGSIPTLRTILGATASETLKVEVWLRWDPSKRRMRLWASSVADWKNLASMREVSIAGSNQDPCSEAFREGRPQFGTFTDSRWLSQIAAPIWLPYGKSEMVVGTVLIGSTSRPVVSSIGAGKNSASIVRAISFAEALGLAIAAPGSDELLKHLEMMAALGLLDAAY